jgi:hypothetical protein
LDSEEKRKPEQTFTIKGIPILAYLTETGDFRWIPTPQACNNSEQTRQILAVLNDMPEDRKVVWASRLDIAQTKTNCPIINKEDEIRKEFDALSSTYDAAKLRNAKTNKGGERE